jgi:PIN domain nuclease of toxin-antitoxin system
MRLLLDTHTVLWSDQDSPQLGATARLAILEASEVYVSAASEWELSIKHSTGRVSATRSIETAARDAGFELLPISFAHTRLVKSLPLHHRDPFDRLLIATALYEGLTIVSADRVFSKYDVPLFDATE